MSKISLHLLVGGRQIFIKIPYKTHYVLGGDLVNAQYPLKLHLDLLRSCGDLVDTRCPLKLHLKHAMFLVEIW